MPTEQAISEDAPVMKAWNNYRATEEYANSRKWATNEEHVEGSMWAAFYTGFFAAAVNAAAVTEPPKEPEYVFDPDDWETTYSWKDCDELTDGWTGELWEPHEFATLVQGPRKWAKEVIVTRDENGDPDETEIRWFDSAEAAIAADCPPKITEPQATENQERNRDG